MVTLNLTAEQHNTLLTMMVEMVTGQPVDGSVDTRAILSELIESTEAEDALNDAGEEERGLIEAMSGMTIEEALAEIGERKALVSVLVGA